MAKLIGTDPNQVPTNADLGTMAYQDYDVVAPQFLAGRRNLIINGDMRINQRQNTPFTGASGYTLDRWNSAKNYGGWSISGSTGHAAETGFNHAIKVDCTSTATMGAASYAELQHKIEGLDLQHLQWGGAKGKSVTLSFWVKSNLTGLYSVTVVSGGNLYNASYIIDNPNTWEKKYITIPPLTTASITDGAATGMVLEFWIALGTDYTNSTTDWGSSPSYGRNGQVDFMSSTDNEWLLTGVQLELGKVATPFEHRSYGEELALCQRYYYKSNRIRRATQARTDRMDVSVEFPATMRATPTVTETATAVMAVVSSLRHADGCTIEYVGGVSGSSRNVTEVIADAEL